MLLLSKIAVLHILDRFGDHTTKKKKISHTIRHKFQPNFFYLNLHLFSFILFKNLPTLIKIYISKFIEDILFKG